MYKKTIIACVLFLLVFGCSSSERPESKSSPADKTPAYGDTLIEGSIGDASNLIPLLATDGASHSIAGLVYNGLVKYDKNINIVGDLAQSWDISPDGLTITFHLRKGVKWHDGEEFTAADCLFTYRKIIDPKTPTAYESDFLMVKKAEVVDTYTFRVSYGKPFAPALISWGIAMLPEHLLKGWDITKSPLSQHPVGTGPYIFKSWSTGEKIVLMANPDYFEGRPYLDKYIYRIIPDTATMFLELKSGGIDEMGLSPLQYKRQTTTKSFKKDFKKYRYLSFVFTFLGYNLESELFKDRRVRQAISYAIDKQELIDGVLLGLGKIATGPYKPGTWAYNPDVKRYRHNRKEARRLLAEAGWRPDQEGMLEKQGKPFEFTVLTNQGNSKRAKTAEIIQQRLQEVGITMKIRILEWAAFIKEFVNKRKFDALILGFSLTQDPDTYDMWHSSKTKPGEFNMFCFKNAEVDRLLVEGRGTFDQKKRKKAYFRIQEILAREQPCTFLYVSESLPVISSRIQGVEPAPLGIGHNFIRWYVPKHRQRYMAP